MRRHWASAVMPRTQGSIYGNPQTPAGEQLVFGIKRAAPHDPAATISEPTAPQHDAGRNDSRKRKEQPGQQAAFRPTGENHGTADRGGKHGHARPEQPGDCLTGWKPIPHDARATSGAHSMATSTMQSTSTRARLQRAAEA